MDFNEISTFIQGVGFPIFAAAFYMIKGTQDTKAVTDALTGVKETLAKLQTTIEQIEHNEKGGN